jgi:hypothetical protein
MTSVLKDLGAIGPPFSTVPVRENSDSLSRTIIAWKSEHRHVRRQALLEIEHNDRHHQNTSPYRRIVLYHLKG